MAASSKTIMNILQPAKRRKLSSSSPSPTDPLNLLNKYLSAKSTSSDLTPDQITRIELNKLRAKSKRNLKLCSQLVSNSKGSSGHVKLEELLVEDTWREVLPGELEKPYFKNLCKFVESEISNGSVAIYPPQHLIFNALNSTPFNTLKAVIIGQDPYHGPGQAMGLSFSVPQGLKAPSSLVNIFKELKQDLGCTIPSHGNLEKWAIQGVLLLNTVLTVRNHQANSHSKKGWEHFTDAVIKTISQKKEGVVFLLWGNSAQEKSKYILVESTGSEACIRLDICSPNGKHFCLLGHLAANPWTHFGILNELTFCVMSSALTPRTINSRKSKIEYQRNVGLWSWFNVEPNLLADRASYVELPNSCLLKGIEVVRYAKLPLHVLVQRQELRPSTVLLPLLLQNFHGHFNFFENSISLSPLLRDSYKNNNVIFIASNPVTKSRSKHIDIDYHFFGYLLLEGLLVSALSSHLQLDDVFTKVKLQFLLDRGKLCVFHLSTTPTLRGDIKGQSDSSDYDQDINDSP